MTRRKQSKKQANRAKYYKARLTKYMIRDQAKKPTFNLDALLAKVYATQTPEELARRIKAQQKENRRVAQAKHLAKQNWATRCFAYRQQGRRRRGS